MEEEKRFVFVFALFRKSQTALMLHYIDDIAFN
jgi:hypothetical protein